MTSAASREEKRLRRQQRTRTLIVLMALAWHLPSPAIAQTMSVEDIVARSARAMGGGAHLESLRTLRFRFQPQDRDQGTEWEIIRPDKVRKQWREGAGDALLVFDGLRAAFLRGPAREDGTLEGPHLIPEQDWHHFEVDIALYIPAYFDFPAEYLGPTTVDGNAAHLLGVTLPMGGVVVYAVDAESFLPVRVDVPDWGLRQRMGDYRESGGIMYPHRVWNAADPRRFTVLEGLAVNAELDRDRFLLPRDIR